MKKFRLELISLIAVLGLFFNIERLDIGSESPVNIDSFVYVLGLLAVIVIIAFPTFWRNSVLIPLGLVLVVHFIGKFVVFDRPLLGGIYTYLTIAEISFLSLIVWLSYQLTRTIQEFEDTVKEFTNSFHANKLPDVEKSQRIINTEITRSRHYERPMSIITIRPTHDSYYQLKHRMIQEIQEKTSERYTKARMAQTIRKAMRRIDTVLDTDQGNSLMILCPEVDETETITLLNHVQSKLENDLDIKVLCSSATFPTDGVTFSALVETINKMEKTNEADLQQVSSTKAELKLQE